MRRRKKALRLLLFVSVLLILTAGIVSFSLHAAKCTNGVDTCEGDCCKASALGCEAGPCDVIFPQ
jgi:hypothetical protein